MTELREAWTSVGRQSQFDWQIEWARPAPCGYSGMSYAHTRVVAPLRSGPQALDLLGDVGGVGRGETPGAQQGRLLHRPGVEIGLIGV